MTIHGSITFDGVDLRNTYGVDVVRGDIYRAPAPELTPINVPGRSGDLLLPGNRYPNVTRTYIIMIRRGFQSTYAQLRAFLLSRGGYCRLEDTWHPDEYYMAYVAADFEPTVSRNGDQGKFTLELSRKPQRYLKSGEAYQPATGGSLTLTNPTYFNASPMIRWNEAQSSDVEQTLHFSYASDSRWWELRYVSGQGYETLYIDCAAGAAYGYDTLDATEIVTGITAFRRIGSATDAVRAGYPQLLPGRNFITATPTVSFQIAPRWWTL